MKIHLKGHKHQFAIEQTVMALLPGESIETIFDQNTPITGENVLESALQDQIAHCFFSWQGKIYQSTLACSPETEQYALKTTVFLAVCQILEQKPPWGSLSGVRPAKLALKYLEEGKSACEIFQKDYYVDEIRAKLAEECALISQQQQARSQGAFSIYVGIPFCPSRCHYCSFFSQEFEEKQLEQYLDSLFQEISAFSLPKITSLYVGGGTPTVLSSAQLARLCQLLRQQFPCVEEFTIEAGRPETLTQEKIQVMSDFGVQRISINPQSLRQETLDKMGRNHRVEDVFSAYALAKDKFTLNMDLIAGLAQSEDFLFSLQQVLALKPQQITVHSLSNKRSAMQEKNPETQENWVEIMDYAWNLLRESAYAPYYLYRQKQITQGLENLGWALPDSQGNPGFCHYNVAMMEEFQSILGFGAGSMTKIIRNHSDSKKKILRQQNTKFPRDYNREIHNIMLKKKQILQDVL